MDRSRRQKINKTTVALNDTLDQMDITDIYKTFHPKTVQYTFFSSAHGMFSKIDNMIGQKTHLNKYKKAEIISSIFSNHNSSNLEINYTKKTGKNTSTWRLNNLLPKNQWVNKDIKEEMRKYIETKENKNTAFQNL